MSLRRKYYPLAEAAKLAGYAEEDLIHFGATGQLKIWAMLNRLVSVNAVKVVEGWPDFSEWVYGEEGEFLNLDFLLLSEQYFKEMEAGRKPELHGFAVEGSEGEEIFFLSKDDFASGVELRLFVKEIDLNAMISPSCQRYPIGKGDHISNKLAIMNQAAAKFWANADRNDRGTHPDNATVVAWLCEHSFSPTLAEKAATIIRPEWVPAGRKPEK